MQTYLVRLACHSPYLTPWRNCTLWGRFSWLVASSQLPGWSIQDWLECYRIGEPPLVVGDAFPYEAFPVPALYLAEGAKMPQAAPNQQPVDQKPLKTLPWPHWQRLCKTGVWPRTTRRGGKTYIIEEDGTETELPQLVEAERMHVVIDRSTGTTVKGGLRTERGTQPAEGVAFVASVDASLGESGLRTLLHALCLEGWGYGRTTGYGHIELVSIEPLERPQGGTHFTTLGHIHPTDDLPQDGYWRWTGVPVRPHDKSTRKALTQLFTTMFQPGATFAGAAEVVGKTVGREDDDNYLHFGLAPTWPIQL